LEASYSFAAAIASGAITARIAAAAAVTAGIVNGDFKDHDDKR